MISYGLAKARAMAGRDDWNEREAIRSATILWYDTEDEGYELEIENEDELDAEEIDYETEWIDDDALFEAECADACESEWEWMTGR